MPKIAAAILLALLLFPAAAHADRDFSTIEPDAVCGNVGLYDYGAVIDGPTYYVDMTTRKIICLGGGACRGPNRANCQCPPNMWACPYPDLMKIYERKIKERRENSQ